MPRVDGPEDAPKDVQGQSPWSVGVALGVVIALIGIVARNPMVIATGAAVVAISIVLHVRPNRRIKCLRGRRGRLRA